MATFEQLARVVLQLTRRRASGKGLAGELLIDSETTLADLLDCAAAVDDTDLSIETMAAAQPAIGQAVEVTIGTPRPSFGLVLTDLDALLRFQSAHVREPPRYVLWEAGISRTDPASEGSDVDRYRKVLALVQVLKGTAAFLDEHEEVLVFIKGGKFEVPVSYTAPDLRALDLAALHDVVGVIPEGTHKAQCQAILSEAVHEVLAQQAPAVRFGRLLAGLPEVRERFDRGYRLFAAGFSYEKLRDQVEAARIEYTGKMHKVFSDIQNQLLGIPVATVIVATQMKPHDKVGSEFWISVAILLGSFVFAMLVHLLLRNQRHTLEVVGIEIRRQHKELEKQPHGVVANLLPTFELLEQRYRTQQRILQAVDWVVLAGVALSVFFFYQLSGPARLWVDAMLLAATSP
ncbi:hypothetical protein [Aquabacterium humicola]|uniref:hypothetical protein n=1 Tax=Aquabacterium humicola TaxID=3237377 RepID=UPI0025429B57|nr:hypothetical protein [Rubrivivax pictus]